MEIYPSGSRIGDRFEVVQGPLEKRGLAGGMGLVYLCIDHDKDHMPVALKTFRPELLADRASRDRFLREGALWVELEWHPNIVRAHQVIQMGRNNNVYLVLELVAQAENRRDASLRSWLIPGHSLPKEQALRFALHIARGMRYATTKKPTLVHRDLKPENVLVGADGRVRVTDFGLATTLLEVQAAMPAEVEAGSSSSPLSHRTQLTRGGVVGTPLYMAPEQWQPGTRLDARTDIYAFGCIVYEMLTGRYAIEGESFDQLKQGHVGGAALALATGLSPAYRELVARCVALDAAARYGSWSEVEAAVSEVYARVVGQAPEPEALVGSRSRGERIEQGWSYDELGKSYMDIGKCDVALSYYERARAIGEEEGERRLVCRSLAGISHAQVYLGGAQEGIRSGEQSLALAREIGDRFLESNALSYLGRGVLSRGQLDQAMTYLTQALQISVDNGDLMNTAVDRANLSLTYRMKGDVQRAIQHLELALPIFRAINSVESIAKTLGGLGQSYRMAGDPARGLNYSRQALALFREIGDRLSEGNELSFQGHTYYAMGDISTASTCWQESLEIAEETGNKGLIGNNAFALAQILAQRGQVQEAMAMAERARRAYLDIGHSAWAQDASNLIQRLQVGPTDPSQAVSQARIGEAFNAFQTAKSVAEMQQAVRRYPFMAQAGFLELVAEVIQEQVPPEAQPALKERLASLRRIAGA